MQSRTFFHFYKPGADQHPIFITRDNYLKFLQQLKSFIKPHVEIIAYCLMPHRFDFLVYTKDNFDTDSFKAARSMMFSAYANGFTSNREWVRTLLDDSKLEEVVEIDSQRSATDCLYSIHEQPLKPGLLANMEDWEYSSFPDYAGLRNYKLCNKRLAVKLLNLPEDENDFYRHSYQMIDKTDKVRLYA